jgi:HlyD family secretion protein
MALAGIVAVALIVRTLRPAPVDVTGVTVRRGPLTVSITEDGRTRIRDRYAVSAPITGLLRRSRLKAGDPIRRGAIVGYILPLAPALLDARAKAETQASYAAALAQVDEAEAAVAGAHTAAEVAQREARRQWALLEGGATSVQAVEQAAGIALMRAADLARADAALNAAREEASRRLAAARTPSIPGDSDLYEVRAPASGQVLRLLVESEGVVQSGTPLIEIGDPRRLELVVDVLSTDAVTIPPGARVIVDRWGGDAPLRGRVDRIEPSAFTSLSSLGVEEQRVNVIATLEESPAARPLGDGYQIEAQIVTWETPSTLLVSAGALFRVADGWAVYTVSGDHARSTPVTIGHSDGKWVQVLSGLKEGDLVVAYPGDNITDGSVVRIE